MGLVYADITLINGEDLILAKRHFIEEEEVKQMNLNILVDTEPTIFALTKKFRSNYNFRWLKREKPKQLMEGL